MLASCTLGEVTSEPGRGVMDEAISTAFAQDSCARERSRRYGDQNGVLGYCISDGSLLDMNGYMPSPAELENQGGDIDRSRSKRHPSLGCGSPENKRKAIVANSSGSSSAGTASRCGIGSRAQWVMDYTTDLWLPTTFHPSLGNPVKVVLGPQGTTHKRLQWESETSIRIFGGTVDPRTRRYGYDPSRDEKPLHLKVWYKSPTAITKLKALLEELVEESWPVCEPRRPKPFFSVIRFPGPSAGVLEVVDPFTGQIKKTDPTAAEAHSLPYVVPTENDTTAQLLGQRLFDGPFLPSVGQENDITTRSHLSSRGWSPSQGRSTDLSSHQIPPPKELSAGDRPIAPWRSNSSRRTLPLDVYDSTRRQENSLNLTVAHPRKSGQALREAVVSEVHDINTLPIRPLSLNLTDFPPHSSTTDPLLLSKTIYSNSEGSYNSTFESTFASSSFSGGKGTHCHAQASSSAESLQRAAFATMFMGSTPAPTSRWASQKPFKYRGHTSLLHQASTASAALLLLCLQATHQLLVIVGPLLVSNVPEAFERFWNIHFLYKNEHFGKKFVLHSGFSSSDATANPSMTASCSFGAHSVLGFVRRYPEIFAVEAAEGSYEVPEPLTSRGDEGSYYVVKGAPDPDFVSTIRRVQQPLQLSSGTGNAVSKTYQS